ncbi:type III-B CRISPR-associated protein Cas10/Cmr2 [Moorellaceae bacterium AZ2]
MKDKLLHFSIGPVQDFVAQARKTRDFWAGSFILSYLSGKAILEVIKNKGRPVVPQVETDENITDRLLIALQKISNGNKVTDGPTVPTLPNRFIARVPAGFDPRLCVEEVEKSWRKIADAVWHNYVAPIAAYGQGTSEIWERQVNDFWEITWAVGEDMALLDYRKNWRSRVLPVEPGDKCSLMGNLQELSGFIRSKEREKQDAFWSALREKVGGHELEEGERLSAVALIKRLFPLVAQEAIGWSVQGEAQRYPSTPYLAAVTWLSRVIRTCPEEVRHYAARAARLPKVKYREDPDRFQSIQSTLEQYPAAREFASLNGNCFFDASLANPNLWRDNENPAEASEKLRQELREKLRNFARKTGEPPTPFFALLLMDGDRMGALLRRHEPERVSMALNLFSSQVPEIVRRHDGVLVYAGGDDVLALAPLETAMDLALALREIYAASFRTTQIPAERATISGALIYAHYNTPLTGVIREAHHLLDRVAKEQTGRNSLAVTVWKGAGRILTWAVPWQIIGTGRNNLISELLNSFSSSDAKEKEYNFTFFYNLRQRLAVLTDEEGNIPLDWTEKELIDVLAAEYRRNREREVDWATAQQRMERLVKICRRYRWDEKGEVQIAERSFVLDGVMLIKFLVQKGVEL